MPLSAGAARNAGPSPFRSFTPWLALTNYIYPRQSERPPPSIPRPMRDHAAFQRDRHPRAPVAIRTTLGRPPTPLVNGLVVGSAAERKDSYRPGAHLRPLALVNGASSGIGFELVRLLATDGYDLANASG